MEIEKLRKSSSGISITPFEWEAEGKKHLMEFISGFAGARLEDGFVKTQMGWAVAEEM